ncbi:extensin-like protein [Roseibacterium elongatum DSM 19469]|uniref:Extensin-like protein n=1 Tax=Roseicyclus elongatus DSM 19469 TaxID=1294273 RepID=W8S619_9RHOB|nr:extensin family protein [Roseibacterium elongatum]AHM04296.1 extensin-like protein [Roseibacterium elongatum DSM 19469]
MRRAAAILAAGLIVAAAGAAADAPDRSPRPVMRAIPETPAPVDVTRVTLRATAQAPRRSLRPQARPGAAAVPDPPPVATMPAVAAVLAATPDRPREGAGRNATALAVVQSLRPSLRPQGLEGRVRASATRQTPARVAQPGQRGQLCGVRGLEGDRLEAITGRISGCGIAEPVRLRAIDGIPLTQPATINCTTARAFQEWVRGSVVPTVGRSGGGVSNIRVVASYACRTRNSQAGARLSEHARGNAVDIAGIGLANGTELTVLGGWRDRRAGPLLQEMHRAACGTFGTVLGPNSDRFHQDHFHFDVASYRGGPYCR